MILFSLSSRSREKGLIIVLQSGPYKQGYIMHASSYKFFFFFYSKRHSSQPKMNIFRSNLMGNNISVTSFSSDHRSASYDSTTLEYVGLAFDLTFQGHAIIPSEGHTVVLKSRKVILEGRPVVLDGLKDRLKNSEKKKLKY